MRTRMLILILLIVVFQLLTYSAALLFGGEFRDLSEYSYNIITEKTENSSNLIQKGMQEKSTLVLSYSERLDSVVAGVLAGRGASAADLKRDRALGRDMIGSSVDIVADLLRHSRANDAYLILDTGELYADGGKAALYLHIDSPSLDPENSDVQMLFGFESVSQEYGFTLHSGWAQLFSPGSPEDPAYDFYNRIFQTALENRGPEATGYGYWSRPSRVTSSVAPSIRFSLPLTAEDGTVYGILGVGLSEDTVMSGLPSDNTTCYVLGYNTAGVSYEILARSGTASGSLLGASDTLNVGDREEEGIYSLGTASDMELLGGVRYLNLYRLGSPYTQERWALITAADRSSVLHPLLFLQRMMAVSSLLSLIAVALVAIPGCGVVIKPLTDLSTAIKTKRNYYGVVRFPPTNIYELDEIMDSITKLQINVQGFSSQVSKMISIADVGLGTFMYNRMDDSVFVGQSLINVLGLSLPQGEDIVMSRREFMNSIGNPEIQALIAAGMDMASGEIRSDFSEVHQVKRLSGDAMWIRLSYSYSPQTIVGTVQDITDTMIEKNRIEHERDHDILTGLLSRQAYYRQIEELFHNRQALKITAFIMVDLDNLKYVNDSYGHDFGDSYIKTAANVLKKFENHGGIVARLSGDEFNICLPGFSSKEEVRQIIADVRSELLGSKCLLADGTHFNVGACMGVSWYPDDAESRELLMKYADYAMYTVKHSIKGGIAEFDINSYGADSAKLADLEELNRIIDEASVKYAFQSIVSVKTGETYGYEALMRVQSEIFQSPLELLSIAKTSAKLHEIERLTWTRALADFQSLVEAGRIEKDALLFINSIASIKLAEEEVASLENTHPDLLGRIVMELLENESADEDSTVRKEQIMYRWGGQIALDDYGTGYNSEYALLTLHPNIIKIDRSIITGCNKDSDRRMIIENLVKLTKAKGVLVLAEGVETREEMETVISCGVDFLQGFYLARPVFEPKPIDADLAETIRRLAAQNEVSDNSN